MTFEAFVELYTKDKKPRLKENTWLTKDNIIQQKILPYFGKRKISEITTKDVIAWQNEMLAYRDEKRKPYSQTYLKSLHNQLSAIFNHAVRYYDLRSNPAAKAGNMGVEERKEMLFWTKAEYQRFADAMMDKPLSYYAFEMLYGVKKQVAADYDALCRGYGADRVEEQVRAIREREAEQKRQRRMQRQRHSIGAR